jgi:hypothetical protein
MCAFTIDWSRIFKHYQSTHLTSGDVHARCLPATTTTHFEAAVDCLPPNAVAYGVSRFFEAVGLPSRSVHATKNGRAVSVNVDYRALSTEVGSAKFRPYHPYG